MKEQNYQKDLVEINFKREGFKSSLVSIERGWFILVMSKEMAEMYNANVGWGKLFAPNESGIRAFIQFYKSYIHHKNKS